MRHKYRGHSQPAPQFEHRDGEGAQNDDWSRDDDHPPKNAAQPCPLESSCYHCCRQEQREVANKVEDRASVSLDSHSHEDKSIALSGRGLVSRDLQAAAAAAAAATTTTTTTSQSPISDSKAPNDKFKQHSSQQKRSGAEVEKLHCTSRSRQMIASIMGSELASSELVAGARLCSSSSQDEHDSVARASLESDYSSSERIYTDLDAIELKLARRKMRQTKSSHTKSPESPVSGRESQSPQPEVVAAETRIKLERGDDDSSESVGDCARGASCMQDRRKKLKLSQQHSEQAKNFPKHQADKTATRFYSSKRDQERNSESQLDENTDLSDSSRLIAGATCPDDNELQAALDAEIQLAMQQIEHDGDQRPPASDEATQLVAGQRLLGLHSDINYSRRQPPSKLSEQQLEQLGALIEIIRSGNYKEFVELLQGLAIKRNLLNVFINGQTALHYSLLYGRSLDWCKQLVLSGANPNQTNRAGWHPIHLAAYSCSGETMRYLIDCVGNQ